MAAAGNSTFLTEFEELFDRISNNGREWAQLVNRIRIVFERSTYIFPVRDAVYLWHTYRQKVITRREILDLLAKIIHIQDPTLAFDEIAVEVKVAAMWKHKHQLNDRRIYDLSKKFMNLPFVPVFIADGPLPFTEEVSSHKPVGKRKYSDKSRRNPAPSSASAAELPIKRQPHTSPVNSDD